MTNRYVNLPYLLSEVTRVTKTTRRALRTLSEIKQYQKDINHYLTTNIINMTEIDYTSITITTTNIPIPI